MAKQTHKKRLAVRASLKSAATVENSASFNGVYILKLVVFVLIGSMWLHLVNGSGSVHIPLPVGLIVGALLASHEHFQIDRKIEFVALLLAALIGYSAQIGLFVTLQAL